MSPAEREVMQRLIDALDKNDNYAQAMALAEIRAALAQPDVPESCCGETKPVALQDDEIYDAAFSAYCKGENSRELFRIMWGNRLTCSIGWDREELKSFARNIAALYTAPPQRKQQQAMRLYKSVERLALQADEDTDESIEWLCGEHGGMFKLYEKYFSPQQRERVQFPMMLRKMWSGSEVQSWLDENVNKEKNA